MVDMSLGFGHSQWLTIVSEKAFVLDLTEAFFLAARSPEGVEGHRGLELKAEDYSL